MTGVEKAAFEVWLTHYRERAFGRGLAAETLEHAFAGVRFDPAVIASDRNQAEFDEPIWSYLDRAVSEEHVVGGRMALNDNRHLLERIAAGSGVPAGILAAIWGVESAYGTRRGAIDTFAALATLASDRRRGPFFERQLEAALRILQSGVVARARMRGSWAGAMGHTQLMPATYLAHAVDHDGDGTCDIWGEDPSDALATTAAVLKQAGWRAGQPWGMEVMLPEGFDLSLADQRTRRTTQQWTALGLTDPLGGPLPDHGPAALLLPGGGQGAAFLVFDNFVVLKRYNAADAYAIAVGHLADRIRGGPQIRHGWPRRHRALRRAEVALLQRRLTAAGFPSGGVDGRIGPGTRDAIRAWQIAHGAAADGFATLDLLDLLRGDGR